MTKDRHWLYIAILGLIVALVWVGVSMASNLRKSAVFPEIEKVMAPLDPTIDRSIFVDLSKRKG